MRRDRNRFPADRSRRNGKILSSDSLADLLNMTMVGAATAAQHIESGDALDQRTIHVVGRSYLRRCVHHLDGGRQLRKSASIFVRVIAETDSICENPPVKIKAKRPRRARVVPARIRATLLRVACDG
jgi:hypothetical protein